MVLHEVSTTQKHLTNTLGKRKIPKYLQKSCYLHIKYIAPTFMAAFMWSRPLNSVSQEIIIQKKRKKKSDGTNTQVVAQMMNKCRGRMVQKDYIMGNIFHKVGGEKNRERGPQQSQLPLYFVYVIYMSTCLLGHGVHPYQLLSNSLKPSSLTHFLQIYCTWLTEPKSHTIWAWAANCDLTTNN